DRQLVFRGRCFPLMRNQPSYRREGAFAWHQLARRRPGGGEPRSRLASRRRRPAAVSHDGRSHSLWAWIAVRRAPRRRMLTTAVEQMAVGFLLAVAPSGRLVFANRYMEALHGRVVAGLDVFEYARETLHTDGQPYAPEEHPLAYALRGQVVRDQEMLAMREG